MLIAGAARSLLVPASGAAAGASAAEHSTWMRREVGGRFRLGVGGWMSFGGRSFEGLQVLGGLSLLYYLKR